MHQERVCVILPVHVGARAYDAAVHVQRALDGDVLMEGASAVDGQGLMNTQLL